MKIVIRDRRGETSFDTDQPSSMIRNQLELLEGYRDDGRIPGEGLLRDIATYQFILRQPDPDATTDLYRTAKCSLSEGLGDGEGRVFVRNHEVADLLGWDYWDAEEMVK